VTVNEDAGVGDSPGCPQYRQISWATARWSRLGLVGSGQKGVQIGAIVIVDRTVVQAKKIRN
jgi:hypothetical protein